MPTLAYSAALVPAIANSPADVDAGMRLGYSWKKGPFELIDELGADWLIERLEANGESVPPMLAHARGRTFYRIEGGMLSYQADVTLENNPFEIGMDRLVDLDMEADFVSKTALRKIKQDGITQKQVGLEISGAPFVGSNDEKWVIEKDGVSVGMVTSAIYSPRLEKNIALALVAIDHADLGNQVSVKMNDNARDAVIVEKPFFDPKKSITSKS